MKKVIALIAAALLLTALFTACGDENKTDPETAGTETPAATVAAETTVVLETTAAGGKVEQDSEGNTLEIDTDGTLVSVTDKNGNPITVTEYVTTHYIITSSGEEIGSPENVAKSDSASSAKDSSGASSAKDSGGASSAKDSGGSASSKEDSQSGASAPEPSEEETIELDEYELPIIMN